jgi:hypothetical protein
LWVLQLEDAVGGTGEGSGEDESQFEAGDVAVALDGVDALAGDTDGVSELLLGPSASVAELFDTV